MFSKNYIVAIYAMTSTSILCNREPLLNNSIQELSDIRDRLELDPRLEGFRYFSNESISSDLSTLFIIKYKGRTIGGAEFTLSMPGEVNVLSFQHALRNDAVLEKYRLGEQRYGEFSRLVLLPEYRYGKPLKKVFSHFTNKMIQNHILYVFILTDALRTRRYSFIFRSLNLSFEVRKDIDVPPVVFNRYQFRFFLQSQLSTLGCQSL